MTQVATEEKEVDSNPSSNYTKMYGPRDVRDIGEQFEKIRHTNNFILTPLIHTSITDFLYDLEQNPSENGIISLVGYDLVQQIRNGRPWPLDKKDIIRRNYFLTEEKDEWGVRTIERMVISLVERNISISDVCSGIQSDEEYLLIEKLLLKGNPELVNKTLWKLKKFINQQDFSVLKDRSRKKLDKLVDEGLVLDKCMSDFYQVRF